MVADAGASDLRPGVPSGLATTNREPVLHCRQCPLWYGAEDEGWGPCSIKHQRGDERYLTYGGHECDEGYIPPGWPGNAAVFSGERSTSSGTAVGYSSTSNAGKGKRRAKRRRSAAASSTRRRSRLRR